MKKILIISIVSFSAITSMAPASPHIPVNFSGDKKFPALLSSDESPAVVKWVDSLYNTMKLDSAGLQRNVFFSAIKGYEYLLSKNKLQKSDLLTICDYSQPSSSKRLYIIDMVNAKLLFNTYVSHGKNSGEQYATSFSNRSDSHKSSLGFMVTGETYNGKAGYSLHLDGMENGFNDHVRQRDIVMHGSDYVNGQRADEGTMMGRSYGCPAVPYALHKKIIDKIKDGSCLFIYSPDPFYTHASQILNAQFNWPIVSPSPVNAVSSAGILDATQTEQPAPSQTAPWGFEQN